jgi:hypothetical protein
MPRKSKIKCVKVHKVPIDDYDIKMSELAKIHADIIKRRLNELNATPEMRVLIIDNIIAKMKLKAAT